MVRADRRRRGPASLAAPSALLSALLLAACGSTPRGTPDNEPTLKTLASRQVAVERDSAVSATPAQAIDAYNQFLATTPKAAPNAPQRAEAMRRIGDLEMNVAEDRAEKSSANPDYRAAIARYQAYLAAYPKDPGDDRVLYQLARAYEQGGDLPAALKTLDRLVKDYPDTAHLDEAQFRRGELLFSAGNYPGAEQAYAAVLKAGEGDTFHDRALYMHGWSLFKQGRLDEAQASFFGVLDLKLGSRDGDGSLESLKGLSRADRELVEDTFRVMSLSFANTQGAEAIAPYIDSPKRKRYEFRVYEQLGELYVKQDRAKDAADTFGLFARRNPLHAQAPQLQARVIEIYERGGFETLALQAKKDFVEHYGVDSAYRKANPEGWERVAQPRVKTHLTELARYYHASAQKSHAQPDYDEAFRWYRAFLKSFPDDPQAAPSNFLLAELLFEDKRYAEAATEYEKTAYGYPQHAKSADAGYSALLSYAQQRKAAAPAEQAALQRASVASALRFADHFGDDPRAAPVLADAADQLYALKDTEQAARIAQRVLDLKPAAPEPQRRVAWTVLAHTAFERSAFDQSEARYAEVLKLTPATDPGRKDLLEREAASIYKQGEQARDAGKTSDAVAHFARVATVAPESAVRANAQYDAAAAQLSLKDWDGAIRSLEDFRQRFPNHPLQRDVAAKLAVAYTEKGNWAGAAGEYERIAAASSDPALARGAQWQSAELYEKAGQRAAAAKAYERYVAQNPQPLEPAVEARWRLAKLAKDEGNAPRQAALMREIVQADQSGGSARTDRTRFLGASSTLALAEPVAAAYRQVALVEPLKKNLELKKARMNDALKAYAAAADYGVADVTTAATYQIATVYRDFGRAMMNSERPKQLSKVEREQYDVLLEEQAFPFEEKATEYHEINAKRAAGGVYDEWVKRSFDALRELRPVRYGKTEKAEEVIDAIR